jgi:hypothetical protein
MLTLHHADGRRWPVPDEFALLTTLEPAEFVALVDLARAQARLDAQHTGWKFQELTGIIRTEIACAVNCRHRRDAIARDESPPVCRWIADPAGGFACLQCGTWVKPDSERARVIGLAAPHWPDGIVHVSELRVGDTFRFVTDEEDPQRPRVVTALTTLGNGMLEVVARDNRPARPDPSGLRDKPGDTRTAINEEGGPVMVEIIARALAVVP